MKKDEFSETLKENLLLKNRNEGLESELRKLEKELEEAMREYEENKKTQQEKIALLKTQLQKLELL